MRVRRGCLLEMLEKVKFCGCFPAAMKWAAVDGDHHHQDPEQSQKMLDIF